MKKIKGELTIKAFTDGRNTKVVVTGPKDIKARQLGNFSCTGTARCHEGDHEDSWIGLCIALGRALQVSKENIEELANALCKKKSLVGARYKNLGMITREQVCPNGKVVYHGLRFNPKREVLGRGCIAETWAFEIDSTEIKYEDITWRRYEIIEREEGQPQFSDYPKYPLVAIKIIGGEKELGFVKDVGFVNCWVYLLKNDKVVKVAWENVTFLKMGKDYKVVMA